MGIAIAARTAADLQALSEGRAGGAYRL